jgi:serine/threonine protein kinase
MGQPTRSDDISIWDRAEDDENRRRARVFEQEWHKSKGLGGRPPSVVDYLPSNEAERAAALLALIRVDMACRRDAGETSQVEDYLNLKERAVSDPDFVAGLAFEEFMLRLETGERPRGVEYERRFPMARNKLRELFLIQEAFAGADDQPADDGRPDPWAGFPEGGHRVEGFQLIEELGSGSFSRVYLAHDVHLAGRQVALKVSRGKCDEWLTLARLQHTNIVPIHSHSKTQIEDRTFDLVCMPYFGRVTLNSVIGHKQWSQCLNGRDIQALLDQLQPDSLVDEAKDSSSRRHLATLSFNQAVAWWGSILAEALRHAHERHVLHRDIKPTNILVTPDCEPMLLDFNLARPTVDSARLIGEDGQELPVLGSAESIGGTLAYMAPEHIEAMITGQSRLVDQRADIFALGAVLYEALTRRSGTNASHVQTGSREELLRQTLELRKIPAPALRDLAPDVPQVLDNIIRKCLDPDPARRYVSAAHLGEDLRAIAADKPIRHAYEPIPCRLRRLARHHSKAAATVTIVTALLVGGPGVHYYRKAESERLERLVRESADDLRNANMARSREDFTGAIGNHRRILERIAEEPRLKVLYDQSVQDIRITQLMSEAHARADEFLARAGWLRYRVLHATRFGGELDVANLKGELRSTILPILDEFDQYRDDRHKGLRTSWLGYLNFKRLEKIREISEIVLFESVCAMIRTNQEAEIRSGLDYCLRIASVAEPDMPWSVLRERFSAAIERQPVPVVSFPEPRQENSHITCLQYARLAQIDGHPEKSIQWVTRAVSLRPADPWVHHELALMTEQQGQYASSFDRLEIAVSLDSSSPWARLDRARQLRIQGLFSQAWDDLSQLREQLTGQSIEKEVHPLLALESGFVEQGLGRHAEATVWFQGLIDQPDADQSMRLLAAQALSEQMIFDGRWDDLRKLLERFDPEHDPQSTWALVRARLLQGMELHSPALDTLDIFLKLNPDVVKARVMRVQSLLKLERAWDALLDCQRLVQASNTPTHRRLLDRCRLEVLARIPIEDTRWLPTLLALRVDDPEAIRIWPSFDAETLRQVVKRIHEVCDDPRMSASLAGNRSSRCLLTLAVLESAVGDSGSADTLERTLERLDPSVWTIRTQVLVLLNENRPDKAAELLDDGFRNSFEDPLLVELRARLHLLRGDAAKSVEDFDSILRNRDVPEVRAWRAKALARMARWNEAFSDLSKALTYDPFQPDWRIARASVWQRLGRIDLAIVDLDLAAQSNIENRYLNQRIAVARTQLLIAARSMPQASTRNIMRGVREAFPVFFSKPPEGAIDLKADPYVMPAGGRR